MSSARRELVQALKAGLPGRWRITGYPTIPDNVTVPTVVLWQQSVTRFEQIDLEHLRATLTLWVLVPSDRPETLDDRLDGLLVTLLGVLQPLAWLDWTEAERGVLADSYPGYQITATAVYKIGD